MKAEFEQQAANLNWGFEYGRRDFNNLLSNAEENKTYIVADPVKRKRLKGNTGGVYGYRYRGHFMLLRKSSLDQKYSGDENAKYEKHIVPLTADLDALEDALMGCTVDYDIDWEATEIVNVLSENMDGYIVNYTITHLL
jgi:hypothetical protein